MPDRSPDSVIGRLKSTAGQAVAAIAAALVPSPPPIAEEPAVKLRTVLLNGQPLPYRLIRVRRRSVAIQVDADGVRVRAPRWVPIRDIEAALAERQAWIQQASDWWRRHTKAVVVPGWQDGAQVLYRGQWLTLSIRAGNTSVAPQRSKRKITVTHDLLGVQLTCTSSGASLSAEAIEQAVCDWWWREAETQLLPQAQALAARIGRPVQSVRLSRARTQWGSCNAKGALRLNWRLILLPPHLAEDVVAHEVAHLCELNHSPRFWSVLETMRPGCRERRQAMSEWAGLLQY